jgi:hypothetical protein
VRNRVGLPNRRSARNRTYPGRTSPSDSGCDDRRRAKARLCGGRRPSSRSKPPWVDQGRRSRTDERLACEAPGRPPVGGRDVEGRGGHLRVAALFRSGSTVDAASIPDSGNVASADVVGTGREVGQGRPEACHAACRVVCRRKARTGGTVHWENARACTSGGIGRDGTRTRAGTRTGIAERPVGQQWQAGRKAIIGRVAMTQSSDCRRTSEGTRRGPRVPARTDRKIPTRTRHDARCFWRRNRRADVEPVRSLCFDKARQRQRQEGMAGRRGSVGFVGGKTSEGKNPRGVTGAKQSRKGIGRSNASRG